MTARDPDWQKAQLQTMAERALDHWNIAANRVELQRHGGNATFRVDTLEDAPADTLLLRLHGDGYQSPAQVRSELQLLDHLAASGCAVPRPMRGLAVDQPALIASPAGHVPSPDQFPDRLATLLSWTHGEVASGVLDLSSAEVVPVYRQIGRLMAELHAATATFALPADFDRRAWTRQTLLETTAFADDIEDLWAIIPAQDRKRLRDHVAWAGPILDDICAAEPMRLLHADLHLSNIVLQPDGEIAAIDFDDCGFGPRLFDFAASVWAPDEVTDDAMRRFDESVRAVAEGYAEVAEPPAPLPDTSGEHWRAMVATRKVMVTLFLASRALRREDYVPIVHTFAGSAAELIDRLRR